MREVDSPTVIYPGISESLRELADEIESGDNTTERVVILIMAGDGIQARCHGRSWRNDELTGLFQMAAIKTATDGW